MIKKMIRVLNKFKNDYPVMLCFILGNSFNGLLMRLLTTGKFGIRAMFFDFSVALGLSLIAFLFKKRKSRMIYYIVLTALMVSTCIINSVYYNYYASFSSISLLGTLVFLKDVYDAATEFALKITDFMYLWIFIALIIVIKKYDEKCAYNKEKFRLVLITFLMTIAIGSALPPYSAWTSLFKLWNRVYAMDGWGPYVYQTDDIIQSLKPTFNNFFGYDNALKKTNDYYKERNNQMSNNEYTNMLSGKNIIVIHAESLQTFTMSLNYDGKEVTPNVNKLAREGIYFNNFYAQVGVGTSSDTEFTYATSLLPANNGTVFVNYFNNKFITIQSLLKDNGYYTFSMHGNVGDFWNRNLMHMNMGYDKFYAKDSYIIDEEHGLGLSDKSFFRQSVDIIKDIHDSVGKPYYGTLITLTNHTPWKDAAEYSSYDFGSDYEYLKDTSIGRYIMSVNYMDSAIGEFISKMDQEGLLDNTVIIVYGDHDSRLAKNQFDYLYNYDKVTNKIRTEEDPLYVPYNEYDYELDRKVPFIIWSRDIKYEMVKDIPMGMIDVLPTLGNMLGVYNPYSLGRDIMEISDDDAIVVFKDGSYVTDKIYYNARNGEVYVLTNGVLDSDYITTRTEYANKIMEVSDNIITYDLISDLE